MHTGALPFCNLRLIGRRPREFPRGYPREVRTLGDHIRKKRLDLGLWQRTLAERLGVREETLAIWERGQTKPLPRHHGAVVRFLGYDPEPAEGSLGSLVRARRRALGLSQAELASRLGLDEGTIVDTELGRRRLSRRVAIAVRTLLEESAEWS